MAKRKARHGASKSPFASVAAILVFVLVGTLVTVNWRVNRTTVVSTSPAEYIEQRVAKVNELQKKVNELSAQIDQLNVLTNNDEKTLAAEDSGSSTMLPAVTGEGVVVTLNDSKLWQTVVDSNGSTNDIDKYVVHQSDIEGVVNALWAGGAESMEIMDQRVLYNSAVFCSGTVLSLQGKKYSPPFTVSAIGPVDDMLKALDDSESVRIYKEYVSAYGLGYDVEEKTLTFDKTAITLQPLKYARVLTTDDQKDS